jgi:hypothetical protein
LARALRIRTIVLQEDEVFDLGLVAEVRKDERIIWVTRGGRHRPGFQPSKDTVLRVPNAALNRLGQINIALFFAVLNGLVAPSERILALSGVAGSGSLDTLVISKPERDYPWVPDQTAPQAR